MTFTLYWLISNDYKSTYTGFTDNLERRIAEHKKGKVKTTKKFIAFRCFEIEKVNTVEHARQREKYWKSAAGRKKLKKIFEKLNNIGQS